jgi:autotransporter-associated beta strand protein
MISKQKLREVLGRPRVGTRSRILASLALIISLLALPQGGWADSQTWDKGAGTTDYNTPANWNLDAAIPGTGAGETATFTNTGGFTVNISAATANAVGFSFSHTTGTNYTITVADGVNQELTGVTAGGGGNNGWLELARAGTGTYTLNGTRTFSTIANQEITVSSVVTDAGAAGGINANGAGVVILTGVNTYTGGTTLTAGSLYVGNNNALGTGDLTINGGNFQAKAGTVVSVANNITVNSDFAIGGNSSLTLTGDVDLGGATRIITLNNTSDLTTLSGVVSNGGLTTAGAETLTLGGVNTYTGATTIGAGSTLALNATGTIATSSGVANAGTFTIAADKTIDSLTGAGATTLGGILTIGDGSGTSCTYSGVASGAGGITKAGSGTLTLSGINTFSGLTTVSAGTLDLTGSITGGGGVTVLSPGTFNLTAGGSLIGNINNSGAVALNGTQTGAFTNNADATLTGSGIITGALVNNGTVNPGNSAGTLTVGSYTVNPGATHVVEIASASSYDKVVVTGAGGVTLNGGTLSPRLLGGYLPSANQIFTNIISNTGGGLVTGTFDSVEDSQTLGWRAIYNADSIDLQAYQEFAGLPGSELSVSLSANQRSVANMLNALPPASGDLLEVLNAIHALTTADGVRAAYNDISPEKYAALPTLAFPVTHMQFQYLQNRLARQRWEAELGSDAVSSGGGGFMRGFNFGYDNTKMLLASSTFTLSDAGNPLIRPGVNHRWGIYLEPMANWGNLRPSANMVGYRYKNFGFTLGADYWVTNNWLVGINTGYSKTLTGIGGTGGDINANVIPFNAYSAFFVKGFYVNGTLGYTLSTYDMERNVAFGTINRTAKANTSGNQFQAAAETGYDFKVGNAIVGPTVSLQYATQTTVGFTESNAGALSLRVDSQTADSLQTGIGARASYRAKVGNVTVKPQVAVVWQHEFSNNTRGVNARLAQGSTTMNWRTDKIGQDFAVVSFDLPARVSKNLVAHVGYTAEVGRSKSSNQGINLGLRYEFYT